MPIVRTRLKENFVQIPGSVAEDHNLTPKAFQVFSYLLNKPDSWNVNVNHLVDALKMSKGSVYKSLNTLRAAGYMERRHNVGGLENMNMLYITSQKPLRRNSI